MPNQNQRINETVESSSLGFAAGLLVGAFIGLLNEDLLSESQFLGVLFGSAALGAFLFGLCFYLGYAPIRDKRAEEGEEIESNVSTKAAQAC